MVSYEKAQSETMTNSEFDGKTHLSGTTSQRGSTTKWPTSMPFYDTDLKRWYKNTGTESVPVSSEIGGEGSAYDIVYPLSVTIGDYTLTPAAATATSTASSGNTLDERYTTNTGFTQVGTTVLVDDASYPDQVKFNSASGGSDHRQHKSIGATLNDSLWTAQFELIVTTATMGTDDPQFLPVVFTAGTGNPKTASQDALGVWFQNISGTITVKGYKKDGAVAALSAGSITVSLSTQYYIRVSRTTSTNLQIKVFSDSTFTTQVGSTLDYTIDSTITGLTHFQHSVSSDAGTYTVSAVIDNLSLKDNSSTVDKYIDASNTHDGNTTTYWKSNSEANPAIYWDFTSNRKFISFALNLNTTDTTVSTMELSLSTDTTFSGEVKRTLLESDFTNNTWRYILINIQATDTRYVQLKGSGTGVLSVYEFKARATTDTSPGFGHYHKVISTSSTSASSNDSN